MDIEILKDLLLIIYAIAKEVTIWITMVVIMTLPSLLEKIIGAI